MTWAKPTSQEVAFTYVIKSNLVIDVDGIYVAGSRIYACHKVDIKPR